MLGEASWRRRILSWNSLGQNQRESKNVSMLVQKMTAYREASRTKQSTG